TREAIVPSGQTAVKVRDVSSSSSAQTGDLTEKVIAVSFVPFLAYFMLTWQQHIRSGVVRLFPATQRTNAYVATSSIAQMLRAFIAGKVVIRLLMSTLSA